MQPGVTRDNLNQHMACYVRPGTAPAGIALVLGAGNVSSIAPTDAFSKLFQEGKVVLLKMNPVNEYLGGIFSQAFAAPRRGRVPAHHLWRRRGGHLCRRARIGRRSPYHRFDLFARDNRVGPARTRARPPQGRRDWPDWKSAITSELGNVTPWIVVPGPYTDRELTFQAENVAAMITNNASFNCIATKMIVTSRQWPDRQRFLDKVEAVLARIPRHRAVCPGAEERYARFTGRKPEAGPPGTLPWTLVRDVARDQDPHYFNEESFVCVCAETAIDAATPEAFLEQVPDFVNDSLWGNFGRRINDSSQERAGRQAAKTDCNARS